MAKSNIKTINNNGITQNSNSQVYSNYSYAHNTFIYLNFIKMFSMYTKNVHFSYTRKMILEKHQHILGYYDYDGTMVTSKNNLFNIITPQVKFFFLNGKYTYVLDTINLSKIGLTNSVKGIVIESLNETMSFVGPQDIQILDDFNF